MLEQAFQDVYTKFKLHFYQNIFQRFACLRCWWQSLFAGRLCPNIF